MPKRPVIRRGKEIMIIEIICAAAFALSLVPAIKIVKFAAKSALKNNK